MRASAANAPGAAVPARSGRERALLLALVALGALLRLTGLGVHSLWIDEGCTLYVAQSPDVFATLERDRHPPLSFYLFRLWIDWFGEDDGALRVLPALSSTAALALFVVLAGAWSSARGRIAAVALLAVSPFSIWHGQEVRMYAFLELASVAALTCTALFLRTHRARYAVLVGAAVALAFGVHYYGGLLVPSVCAVAWLALRSGRVTRREAFVLAGSASVGAAVWAPWLVRALPMQLHSPWGEIARVSPMDLASFPVRQVLTAMLGVPDVATFVGYGIGAVLASAVVAFAVSALRSRELEPRLVLACTAVPVLTALSVVLVGPANFQAKYLMSSAPATLLMMGGGLALPSRRSAALASTALACAGCLAIALVHRSENRRDDFRDACADLEQRWKRGEPILVITAMPDGFAESVVRHYLRGNDDALRCLTTPSAFRNRRSATQPDGPIHVVLRRSVRSERTMRTLLGEYRAIYESPVRVWTQYVQLAK